MRSLFSHKTTDEMKAWDAYPALTAYAARMRERESVKKAFTLEAPLYAKNQHAA